MQILKSFRKDTETPSSQAFVAQQTASIHPFKHEAVLPRARPTPSIRHRPPPEQQENPLDSDSDSDFYAAAQHSEEAKRPPVVQTDHRVVLRQEVV